MKFKEVAWVAGAEWVAVALLSQRVWAGHCDGADDNGLCITQASVASLAAPAALEEVLPAEHQVWISWDAVLFGTALPKAMTAASVRDLWELPI
jgi:hypothetical protein